MLVYTARWWLHEPKHVAIPSRPINSLYTVNVSDFWRWCVEVVKNKEIFSYSFSMSSSTSTISEMCCTHSITSCHFQLKAITFSFGKLLHLPFFLFIYISVVWEININANCGMYKNCQKLDNISCPAEISEASSLVRTPEELSVAC
jgi:hypothetical protein